MNCLRCGHLLKNKLINGKLIFQCEHCHSQGVTLSALRGLSSGDQFVNALWQQAKFTAHALGEICPCCKRKMTLIAIQSPTMQKAIEIGSTKHLSLTEAFKLAEQEFGIK